METILNIFRSKALRKKILIVVGYLLIFRFLSAIPLPGVDQEQLALFFTQNQYLGLVNILSGGALSKFSIVMLGIGPYITATIILQLLTMVFPSLKAIYYEGGEAGRAKFNQYAKYLTVVIGFIQGFGFLNYLEAQKVITPLSGLDLITNVMIITSGSVFLMWLGELITEQKIGNGTSLLIFVGILAGIPNSIRNNILMFSPNQIYSYLMFVIIAIITILGVIYINEANRKIPVNYAKRVRGMKVYGGVPTYLPLKINQAGVIPIIFAISILLLPSMLGQILLLFNNQTLVNIANALQQFLNNQLVYGISYFVLVFAFTYFYTALTFEPNEIAKNLQKQGGFIAGIRPGDQTAHYLSNILNRITLFGALFLGIIAVLPLIVQALTGISAISLGGTSLLIVVSVGLETIKAIKSKLLMREYEI